jgi:hypothetical protein
MTSYEGMRLAAAWNRELSRALAECEAAIPDAYIDLPIPECMYKGVHCVRVVGSMISMLFEHPTMSERTLEMEFNIATGDVGWSVWGPDSGGVADNLEEGLGLD